VLNGSIDLLVERISWVGMLARHNLAWAVLLCALMLTNSARSESIDLKFENGVYKVPVLINDRITLDFVLDSGAADVSIPEDVYSTLIRTGTISSSDLLGAETYVLADGTAVRAKRFRLQTLKIGNLVLRDVTGGTMA
jgi:predicted aspartyl protease